MNTILKTIAIGIISTIFPMNVFADVDVIDYTKLVSIRLERIIKKENAGGIPIPRRSPAHHQNLPLSVYFDDSSSTLIIDATQMEDCANYTLYNSSEEIVLSGMISPNEQKAIALHGFADEDSLIIYIEIGGVCYEGWIDL
ncbi:MAG: hypothetical protein K2N13_02400 [Paraprevotella sp.]|nr:hypothetical protein [Paraprevotella sp.]